MRTLSLFALALGASAFVACSNPPSVTDGGEDSAVVQDSAVTQDSASPADATAQNDSAVVPTDGSSATDASADACAVPPGEPPMLNGPMACMTLDFGRPAVMPVNVDGAITFRGGAIPPGIYDAVGYSRTVGTSNGSYRATLVVGADLRYTEVRQISTGNAGPVTRRSGTLVPSGNMLGRMITCDAADGGTDTMTGPYSVETRCDGVYLHYGTTNLWFTYRRR
jgi:hypothetical protein